MAIQTLVPVVMTGVGIPAIGAWLTGSFPSSTKQFFGKEGKNLAIYSLVGLAVAGLANMYHSNAIASSIGVSDSYSKPYSKSVSSVTVQLGRMAGGINYPGQMSDGGLVFID